ncbi:MAG: cysteine rich repeat-containing protein [Pseudomonadota bacterium]
MPRVLPALLLSLSCLALPQAAGAQSIFEACKTTLVEHCSEVEPGHGRLMACLYANEEKLTPECDAATVDVADALDRFFELLRFTQQECRGDIETHCAETEFGGGRIFHCLKQHEAELSGDCATSVATIRLPSE